MLFSQSSRLASAAVQRVQGWRCRGRVPLGVDITASLVGIQLHDPGSRASCPGASDHRQPSDSTLASEYALSIIRLVNGISDARQKGKIAASVANHADAAGLHPMLVDIRHEATHNHMPSLHVLRLAASHALSWLADNYWAGQKQHVASSKNAIASSVAELWQHKQVSAKAAISSSSDDDTSVGGEERGCLSAASIKREKKVLLGAIRNVLSDANSRDLAHIIVTSADRILFPGQSANKSDAFQYPSQQIVEDSAAVLSLLGDQHPHLAGHAFLLASEHLRAMKAALLLLLAHPTDPMQHECLRSCKAMVLLHSAAKHAVSQDPCYTAADRLCLFEQSSSTLSTVRQLVPLLSLEDQLDVLARYYKAEMGQADAFTRSCVMALTGTESALLSSHQVQCAHCSASFELNFMASELVHES
jgi:hypothetical protein